MIIGSALLLGYLSRPTEAQLEAEWKVGEAIYGAPYVNACRHIYAMSVDWTSYNAWLSSADDAGAPPHASSMPKETLSSCVHVLEDDFAARDEAKEEAIELELLRQGGSR